MQRTVLVAPLLAIAAVLAGSSIWVISRVRRTAAERERRRRLALHLRGRLGDANVTEVAGDTIYYTYTVHGVSYTASQDISQLRAYIHSDLDRLFGPVSLKYSPRNPANSIVICEQWSGLREGPRA